LKEREICNVVVCGLAADYCVSWTALDAAQAGFDVCVVTDAVRAIAQDSYDEAKTAWSAAGIRTALTNDLVGVTD